MNSLARVACPPALSPTRPHTAFSRSLAVLMVNENPADRDQLAALLRDAWDDGVALEECASGLEALDAMRRQRIDLVLIDYLLPDMDGLELVSQIADMADDTAVILLSDHGNERAAAQAIKQGARDYVVKHDLTPELLCEAMTEALRTARVEWRNARRIGQLRESCAELNQSVRDMNTQLSAVERAFGALKLSVAPPDEELRQHLDDVEREIHGARRCLDQLHTLQAEAGHLQLV